MIQRRNYKGKLKISRDNENENTTYWNAAKALAREKFIAIRIYKERFTNQINNTTFHLTKLEK